jgi:hypothetical protein
MGLRPVWSAVNTGGIASFPILLGIDGLHIFKEIDPNGASDKAAAACCRQWYAAGRDVFLVTPRSGKDLNDEIGGTAQCRQ